MLESTGKKSLGSELPQREWTFSSFLLSVLPWPSAVVWCPLTTDVCFSDCHTAMTKIHKDTRERRRRLLLFQKGSVKHDMNSHGWLPSVLEQEHSFSVVNLAGTTGVKAGQETENTSGNTRYRLQRTSPSDTPQTTRHPNLWRATVTTNNCTSLGTSA